MYLLPHPHNLLPIKFIIDILVMQYCAGLLLIIWSNNQTQDRLVQSDALANHFL